MTNRGNVTKLSQTNTTSFVLLVSHIIIEEQNMGHLTDNSNAHTNNENENTLSKKNSTVSFRGGYNFLFEDEGHLIRVHGSAVTGKESIYVDDKLVTDKRSLGRRSCLSFAIDGIEYEAEFYVANLLTGETHCSLIKEGVHVETLKRTLKKSQQLNTKSLLISLLTGAIAGFCGYMIVHQFFGK